MIEPTITLTLSESEYDQLQIVKNYKRNCGKNVLLFGFNEYNLRSEVIIASEDTTIQNLIQSNQILSKEVEVLRKENIELKTIMSQRKKWYNFF